MSVRAYKLIEIKTVQAPTFNASHNAKIYDLGARDNSDVISYEKELVEEELKKDTYTKEEKEILQAILKDMGDEDYVEYYCF